MKKLLCGLFLSALLWPALVTAAHATVMYQNDFQDGSFADKWTISGESTLKTDTAPNKDLSSWGRFLGQFRNDSVKLSLAEGAKGRVTVSFDTYFIRSWDGNDSTYGQDMFKVGLGNGATLLNDTFSNGNPAGQSYAGGTRPAAYGTGANNSMAGSSQQWSLGYFFNDHIRKTNEAMDSVYNFKFTFLNDSDSLDIIFGASGLQTDMVEGSGAGELYYDESWGLDNIVVDVAPVPEPSTWLLLCSGLLFVLVLRNKRGKSISIA